jgi:hypothetical protein
MKKQTFVKALVDEGFASQIEAENHTIYGGEDGWLYYNPKSQHQAAVKSNNSLVLYQYRADLDEYWSSLVTLDLIGA